MVRWWARQVRWAQWIVSLRSVLVTLLLIDIAAYFGGLIFWYGYVMARPETPLWAWLFIPDCPLFGLLGGLGLLMVVARDEWSEASRRRAQRSLIAVGVGVAFAWLYTYTPFAGWMWVAQRATLGVLAWSLLLVGVFFRRTPVWLLGIFAFGQIKYGIWTVTAWSLFWQSTAEMLGAPLFSPESVWMTVAHVGLAAQGILLLAYFRPNRGQRLLHWRGLARVTSWIMDWDFFRRYRKSWFRSP
jgi:uncharacterized membrane protein YpjA